MDEWIVWVIVAVVFAVGEIANMSFYLLPFAIGAGAAAIVSLAGGDTALSVVTFVILTAISFGVVRPIVCILLSVLILLGVRPIARQHRRMPAKLRTGTAALVGRDALVVEAIEGPEGMGRVKIEGEVWTARAYDDDEVIEAGKRVQVIEIRGATALVAD